MRTEPAFARLKEYVIGETGLAYYADKEEDLARRVAVRIATKGVRTCAAYLDLLHDPVVGKVEFDELIKDLTIGETFFFRHAELFDALSTVILPAVITRNQAHRRIRIWSAGCATGAEVYSLAILLRRNLTHLLSGGLASWDISIVGTDINRDFLAQAQEGRYTEWALRSTPEEIRQSCFTRRDRTWLLQPAFKVGVSFQYHNLVTHPYPSFLNNLVAFDLILCRNVMIYFSRDIVQHLVAGFHRTLVPEGWLLVGAAEPSVQLFQGFRPVNARGAIFYQKVSESMEDSKAVFPSLLLPGSQGPHDQAQNLPVFPSTPGQADVTERWGKAEKQPATRDSSDGRLPPSARADQLPSSSAGLDALSSVRALADRGEAERALAECLELLKADQLNPLVHFYHGLVLEQVGRHAEAESALRRAIYLDRRFVLAHYYLGLLLQKGHETAERNVRAVRSFQNVLRLLPDLPLTHVFTDGDGITADELARLTRMHLEILERT